MEIAQAKAFMEQGKNHKAFQLCKKCAEGKHGTANPVLTCTTAKMYQYGIGTVKNFAKAEHYFRKAVRLGVETAKKELAKLKQLICKLETSDLDELVRGIEGSGGGGGGGGGGGNSSSKKKNNEDGLRAKASPKKKKKKRKNNKQATTSAPTDTSPTKKQQQPTNHATAASASEDADDGGGGGGGVTGGSSSAAVPLLEAWAEERCLASIFGHVVDALAEEQPKNPAAFLYHYFAAGSGGADDANDWALPSSSVSSSTDDECFTCDNEYVGLLALADDDDDDDDDDDTDDTEQHQKKQKQKQKIKYLITWCAAVLTEVVEVLLLEQPSDVRSFTASFLWSKFYTPYDCGPVHLQEC